MFSLLKGEKIIKEAEIHWSWILPTLARAMLASAIFASLVYVSPNYFFNTIHGRIITIVVMVGVMGYVAMVWKKERLSPFIITNYRLIDIDKHRLLHSEVFEIPYDHIQSVKTSMSGFWGTILGYGTLVISTAGEESQFESHHRENPRELQSIILTARDEFLRNLGAQNAAMDQSGMASPIAASTQPFLNFFKAMQTMQTPRMVERTPSVGFVVSNEENKSGKAVDHADNSYLVGMLSRDGGFKKNIMHSLTKELGNDGPPRGQRLVKAITSSPHFKKKVTDDLEKELLQ